MSLTFFMPLRKSRRLNQRQRISTSLHVILLRRGPCRDFSLIAGLALVISDNWCFDSASSLSIPGAQLAILCSVLGGGTAKQSTTRI